MERPNRNQDIRTGAIEAATAMMNVAIMVAAGITRSDRGLRRAARPRRRRGASSSD
jgi:hypothetical protein